MNAWGRRGGIDSENHARKLPMENGVGHVETSSLEKDEVFVRPGQKLGSMEEKNVKLKKKK